MTQALRQQLLPIVTVALFLLLLFISIGHLLYESTAFKDALIASDVAKLAEIFERIDQKCKIINFEHRHNHIDFLTVKEFVGSEIGSMNLAYPSAWEGPYVKDNPTMQEEFYQIVRTKKGYFIVPGDGVELSNGKVIGKDIVFSAKSDIEAMAQDPEQLMFEGKVLAARVNTSGSAIASFLQENILRASGNRYQLEQPEETSRMC